jgi:hypothetical protein
MTAGGDDDISFLFLYQSFIFSLNYGRADRSLLSIEKSELYQRASHRLYANAVVVCDKRGRNADNNGISRL